MAISSVSTGLRPGVCTSTTRPTTPYTGQIIYETNTGYLRVWDGSAWDYLSQKQDDTTNLPINTLGAAWQTWTPEVYQPTTAISLSIDLARYMTIQKLVIATFRVYMSGSGNSAQALGVKLPVTAKNFTHIQGSGFIYDSSTATSYGGSYYLPNTTVAWFVGDWATNGVWGTSPSLAIASGDVLSGTFIYEAA